MILIKHRNWLGLRDLDVTQIVWDDMKSDESAKLLEGTYNPNMESKKEMLYEVFF